jgi:hypothetical protein
MSLIDKLAGIDRPNKLAVHTFYAALAEFAAGEVTRAQIVSYFNLSAEDETELDFLIAAYTNAPNNRKQEFLEFIHRLFMLAEERTPGYQTNAEITARINRF